MKQTERLPASEEDESAAEFTASKLVTFDSRGQSEAVETTVVFRGESHFVLNAPQQLFGSLVDLQGMLTPVASKNLAGAEDYFEVHFSQDDHTSQRGTASGSLDPLGSAKAGFGGQAGRYARPVLRALWESTSTG
jgi:hypothetical protein